MAVSWITGADTAEPGSPEADSAAEAASWVLYKLTGEKYSGVSESTEWYGSRDSACGACSDLEMRAYGYYLSHFDFPHFLSDSTPKGLRLRGTPVVSITSIEDKDGVVLNPADYRLVNRAYLIKTDGSCWDMRDGYTITYRHGAYPPELGRIAAIRLANELIKSITDIDNCSLPDRVTSVSRQGISYTILDPQTFIENGRTGVYEIDLFIKTANPDNARKKPKVFSVDRPRGERYI